MGGKKVIMISESTLSKEVTPRFLLYDTDGTSRLLEKVSFDNLESESNSLHMNINTFMTIKDKLMELFG